MVDAVGNSGDDAFGPALEERLAGEQPTLRAHAAEALGHLSPEVARPALVARLEDEESPRVSAAILRSLSRMQGSAELSEAERALAANKLASSTSTEERAALIEWLGHARDQAEARRILAEHFPIESNVRLQQRIGAFVSAEELRGL